MKIHRPFLSSFAHGTLAKLLIYRPAGRKHTVYQHFKPKQPNTTAQANHHILFGLLAKQWHEFTQTERNYWTNLAKSKRITEYNAYLGYNLARLNPTVPNGLIGWWPSICPFGPTLHDLTKYHNDGTFKNMDPTTAWVADTARRGYVFQFDGLDDFILIGNNVPLNNDFAQISITAWVNPFSMPTTEPMIIGKHTFRYGITIYKDGRAFTYIRSGTNYTHAPITTNDWQHVAATFTGTKLSIYINGQLKNTKDPSLYPSTGKGGIVHVGTPNAFFNGRVDDIRMYDRPLDQPEIAQLASR